MFKNLIESLRKKTLSLSDLPETIRVPGHAGQTEIDRLPLDQASVDDLAFAIQGLEARSSEISCQLHSLHRLHDLARAVRRHCAAGDGPDGAYPSREQSPVRAVRRQILIDHFPRPLFLAWEATRDQ